MVNEFFSTEGQCDIAVLQISLSAKLRHKNVQLQTQRALLQKKYSVFFKRFIIISYYMVDLNKIFNHIA